MDPAATLIELDQCISDLQIDRAHELSDAYASWRERGGYEPYMTSAAKRGDAFFADCERRLEDATRAVYGMAP